MIQLSYIVAVITPHQKTRYKLTALSSIKFAYTITFGFKHIYGTDYIYEKLFDIAVL